MYADRMDSADVGNGIQKVLDNCVEDVTSVISGKFLHEHELALSSLTDHRWQHG